MNLIRNVRMDDEEKRKKDIDFIRSELKRADNAQLHKKVDLLQSFLDMMEQGLDGKNVDEAYEEFENAEKQKEIEEFASKEDISEDQLKGYISEYEFSGIIREGEIRDSIEKPMGLLKKRSLVRRIVDFVKKHVEKFQ